MKEDGTFIEANPNFQQSQQRGPTVPTNISDPNESFQRAAARQKDVADMSLDKLALDGRGTATPKKFGDSSLDPPHKPHKIITTTPTSSLQTHAPEEQDKWETPVKANKAACPPRTTPSPRNLPPHGPSSAAVGVKRRKEHQQQAVVKKRKEQKMPIRRRRRTHT